VAIIRDADRLTEEAGNALLKTLEEPPASTHLILLSRGKDQVMETLLSRCQPFHLGPVPEDEVRDFLQSRDVLTSEAGLLSLLSEGRPGWAIKAHRLGLEEEILKPVRALLSAHTSPFLNAAALAQQSKSGHKLEGARERITEWLEVAMTFLRIGLRQAHGLRMAERIIELDPAIGKHLLERTPSQILEQLDAMAHAIDGLRKNISLELVLEDLGALMRKAHI
jgi:DNA polymerase-3 subunit delta'